jgi:hypothetical protein
LETEVVDTTPFTTEVKIPEFAERVLEFIILEVETIPFTDEESVFARDEREFSFIEFTVFVETFPFTIVVMVISFVVVEIVIKFVVELATRLVKSVFVATPFTV